MKKLTLAAALLVAAAPLSGCTDASLAGIAAYGDEARVTCFSGGEVIADEYSTGRVLNAANSDGYEFKSSSTGRLVQFSGDCIIDYGAPKGADFTPVFPS